MERDRGDGGDDADDDRQQEQVRIFAEPDARELATHGEARCQTDRIRDTCKEPENSGGGED